MKSFFTSSAMAALLISTLHAADIRAAAVSADAASSPDYLPRRAFLGLTVREIPGNQLTIVGMVPGSSAASAEFEAGDILLAVNETAVHSLSSFFAALKTLRPGDTVVARVRRKDKELTVVALLKEYPREGAEDIEVLYDAVQTPDAVLRSILTRRPNAKERRPAILFVQGLDCGSIERPFSQPDLIRDLIYGLTRAGFVVMRADRSGTGDSTGTPCREISLEDEVSAYVAALRKLKSYEFVDPQRIFLFGHSAGGWVAPLVASSESVRGIVVYGTVVRPFAEYLVENYRRNRRLRDRPDPVKLEENIREMTQFLHYLVVENLSAAAIVARHPELAAARKILFPTDDQHFYDLRSLRYLQELSAKDVAQAWAKQGAPVLALYGEYDVRTTAMDHEYIAEIINSRHAGHGTWVQVPRMDHGFALHPSLRESVAQEFKGPFGEQVALESANWMRALGTKPPM